jgi:hypothetical protein
MVQKEDNLSGIRTYTELCGKNFLVGVGAMKCGTSWINSYLSSVPEITTSPLKEVHFFDSKFTNHDVEPTNPRAIKRVLTHVNRYESEGDVIKNLLSRPHFQASIDRMKMIYDDNEYFAHFARICTRNTRTLCEITPAYAILGEDGFLYMKNFFATQNISLRILFIMRDPIERLWSHMRFMQERNPVLNVSQEWANILDNPRVLERTDYRKTIESIDKVFPSDLVKYVFYENIFNKDTLRDICNFSGVQYVNTDIADIKNETSVKSELPFDARKEFSKILSEQYDFCRERFGNLLPPMWSDN